MLAALILAGAIAVILGAALITWPAGILAAGVLALLAAADLRR